MTLGLVSGLLAETFAFPQQDASDIRRRFSREPTVTQVTIGPSYTCSAPESGVAQAVVFHPDGKRAYGLFHVETVDIWKLAVHYWPEVLGLILALVAIPLTILGLRAIRRPQRTSEPYCPRCNYHLVGHPALSRIGKYEPGDPEVRCPECGVNLDRRRPVNGVATWKRAALPVCVLALLVSGYGLMWAMRLPRTGVATTWVNWTSAWLFEEAHERQWTQILNQFRTRGDVITEFDVATGHTKRVLYRSSRDTQFPPLLTADGSMMLVAGPIPLSLSRISTETGKRLGSVQPIPASTGATWDPFAPPLIGFSARGDHAYVSVTDQQVFSGRLLAWDLRTDQLTPVLMTEANKSVSRPSKRKFAVLPEENGPRFLSVPGFREAYDTQTFTLKVHSASGEERLIQGRKDIRPSAPAIVTPDGTAAFFSCGIVGVVGYDIESGRELGLLEPGWRDDPEEHLALSPDGRLLAVPCASGSILLRDLKDRRWVARLEHGDQLFAQRPVFSPNGHRLGATCQRQLPGPSNAIPPRGIYPFEIVVFDLSPVLKELDAAREPAPPGGI